MSTLVDKASLSNICDEEIQAQDLVKRGEIDQAIAIYQRLTPDSPRILNVIGLLYAEKQGEYALAVNYYEKSLQIQEKNGDDISDTLTGIGLAYQNLRKFDLALICQFRALGIRELIHDIDQKLIASSLLGIANAYFGQQNLSQALIYAHQALTLNESIKSENDPNLATNLVILANIYHNSGDDIQAFEMAQRALILLEHCVSPDSHRLAPLLNNIATIQVSVGLFNDARPIFSRALHICEKSLPKGHPKRVTIENNIQRVIKIQRYKGANAFSHLWNIFVKNFASVTLFIF